MFDLIAVIPAGLFISLRGLMLGQNNQVEQQHG